MRTSNEEKKEDIVDNVDSTEREGTSTTKKTSPKALPKLSSRDSNDSSGGGSSSTTSTDNSYLNDDNHVDDDRNGVSSNNRSSSVTLLDDNAHGHSSGSSLRHEEDKKNKIRMPSSSSSSRVRGFLGSILRLIIIDFPLVVLFGLYVSVYTFHIIHNTYLYPQMILMKFLDVERQYTDVTYYHRKCDVGDISATSIEELLLDNTTHTSNDAKIHMLTHGASMYPNLISNETASELRDYIITQNKQIESWFVIQNEHRFSWGIDINNMHPKFQTFWKELASNRFLVESLEAIVGKNPAIIEFTAITSEYGAVDQHDHQDVVPPGSATKFAQSFVPSYSLFIPLQDTTYEMGATHVCPGSHYCSENCERYCQHLGGNIPLSGKNSRNNPEKVWKQGYGALVNQQTTHKGMGHTQRNGPDRVVLIATFAPRPQIRYRHGLERRMISQGGSYSLLYTQWGHTFYDYAYSESRMKEPYTTLRSFGVLKADGWNLLSVASMRIINEEAGYHRENLEDFLEKGGFKYLPKSWHGQVVEEVIDEDEEETTGWYLFLFDTMIKTENGLRRVNLIVLGIYLSCVAFLNVILNKKNRSASTSTSSFKTGSWMFVRCLARLLISHGTVVLVACLALRHIDGTNWARNIRNGKSYILPKIDDSTLDVAHPGTLPLEADVLIAPQYASDYLASYTELIDIIHPGNEYWVELIQDHVYGYRDLSPVLQKKISESIVRRIQSSQRRFLIPNKTRRWSAIKDNAVLTQLCHKKLMMASDPLINAMIRQLDSLRSETQFGLWPHTAIHKSIIPAYLDEWEARFVSPITPTDDSSEKFRSVTKVGRGMPIKHTVKGRISTMAEHESTYLLRPTSGVAITSKSEELEPEEPNPGAWIEEGDIVEGMFQCKYKEWYRGVVVRANANEYNFDVKYDDGDVDRDLGTDCVKRFEPYRVGEYINVRINVATDHYVGGEVVKVHEGEGDKETLYDIQTDNDGLHSQTEARHIRRLGPKHNPLRKVKVMNQAGGSNSRSYGAGLQVGAVVQANFEGNGEWFPGRIVRTNSDGTYAVQYEDGDFEESVHRQHIRTGR